MSGSYWEGGERPRDAGDERRIIRQGALLAGLLRFYGRTWRVAEIPDNLLEARKLTNNKSVIYVLWHNRMIMLAYTHRRRGIHVLRSSSRDGRLIAEILLRFGLGAPAGSSSRGGASGLRKLVQLARAGTDVGITVDGPRGPRGRFKAGALQLAALSGSPLLPLAASSEPALRLRGWDRTWLPAPFARLRIRYGKPRLVPRGLDEAAMEALRLDMEAELAALTDALDAEMGHAPLPPQAPEAHG